MKALRLSAVVAVTAVTIGCGGGDGVTGPTILEPIVNCPADLSVTAHNGQAPTVAFDTPVAANGSPPVTVACTPTSGTTFKNGITSVNCVATDSRARRASCSFSVVVTAIPLLAKTTFMAFGDSITEGKTKLRAPAIVRVPDDTFNQAGSYPELLNARLTARYQDQTVTVIAYGYGGEKASEGSSRLRLHWPDFNPDAVMLLEGTNDLTASSTATPAGMTAAINGAIDALRADVVFAKQRGARAFLGTLLPMTPPVAPNVVAGVLTLNSRIRELAAEQAVTLVDINQVVPTTMMGSDGIHPKPGSEVYGLMADEWLKAIMGTMEVSPSTLR